MNFIRSVIRQSLLTNLLSLFVVIAGIVIVINMKREAFPNFSFDIVTVRTFFSGASPEEVEKLVTIPIEEEIKGVSELERVTSISIEGMSLIVVRIDPDATDKDKVVNNIQRAVDQTTDLPDDVDDTAINEIVTGEQAIVEISISGLANRELLQQQVKNLEDQIFDLDGVSRVTRDGWRDREIWIEADPSLLKKYHLSLEAIVDAVRSQSLNVPGGTVKTTGEEYLVRTVGEISQALPYNDIIVRSDASGNMVRVKELGKTVSAFEDDDRITKVHGEEAVILRVVKKASGDTIDIVEKLEKLIKKFRISAPDGLRVSTMNDQSFYIKRRLKVLLNNGWFGMILVLASLLAFLNWRVAVVTAIGIPIAFFLTFIAMETMGIAINLISMFGLIIVLGMIVDDAIIIAENCYRHLEKGLSPGDAAVVGTREVIKPVTVTILTTIASFLPLMFMSGIFGKFVWQIPVVVIIALTASLVEAFFVLPSHFVDFAKSSQKSQHRDFREGWFKPLQDRYRKLLVRVVKARYVFFPVAIIVTALAIVFAVTSMKKVLFPTEGIEIFFIRATMKKGTSLETASKKMTVIENELNKLPEQELDNFITVVGVQQDEPTDPMTKYGTNLGQITVYLTPENDRKRKADEIIVDLKNKIAKLDNFEELSFDRVRPGPPQGKPVAIQIKGKKLELLEEASIFYKEKLNDEQGVTSIASDYEQGKTELRIIVDQASAKRAQLSTRDIALAVRRVYNGEVAAKIRNTDEEIEVIVKYPEEYRKQVEALNNLVIRNPNGRLIPFSQVATTRLVSGVTSIKHHDFKRVVTVTAELDENVTTSLLVNQKMQGYLDEFLQMYPNLNVHFGGEYEDTAKSFDSLKRAFIFSAILIFIILTTLFRSMVLPFIVMLAIPFGLFGVIVAFTLHGMPLSFMAFLGVIGLSGVVVNDSIVLVDFIRRQRIKGVPVFDAIVNGGVARFRPVILTTLTTLVGLLPVAYGIGGDDPFLRPSGMAICWGLAFATAIILLIIPCLYHIYEDLRPKMTRHQMSEETTDGLEL